MPFLRIYSEDSGIDGVFKFGFDFGVLVRTSVVDFPILDLVPQLPVDRGEYLEFGAH